MKSTVHLKSTDTAIKWLIIYGIETGAVTSVLSVVAFLTVRLGTVCVSILLN